MPHAKDADMVRINVFLPPEERDAFDRWCRFGGDRMSMTAAIRELCRMAVSGKAPVDRARAKRLARHVPPPATPTKKPPRSK